MTGSLSATTIIPEHVKDLIVLKGLGETTMLC